ncbi:hypothetical protein OG875_16730 [Streptomyces sp. NBC_01498]|uniref:hypothetical protein n=1 Tax=Streptomyces sp. NBC_01498 TaxID=2975870 RepID=UPI002E7C53F0|nr:hypothetical protein [Streptomyces sp. NBC_01498]WTL26090.1 hypothetical protein OG875_16730 [Streptomyces sp. NBC_01498]
MGTAIGLFVLGTGGAVWGGRYLFNVRGAADKAAERGNAVRAARATGLELAEPQMGPWYFKIIGGIVMPVGLMLSILSIVLAVTE